MHVKNSSNIVAKLLISLVLVNLAYASGLSSMSVTAYLNNSLLQGQAIPPLNSQSQVSWNVGLVFTGGSNNITALLNQTSLNYTDSSGTTSTALNPLQIYWHTNSDAAVYPLNGSNLQQISIISANVLLGSVSQRGLYSSATSAPPCSTNNIYTEWDYYVNIKQNYSAQSRNVVVGRVCFFNLTIGYAQPLPITPTSSLSSTMVINSGAQQEQLTINNTGKFVESSDELVSAQLYGNYIKELTIAPNGTGYVAINSTSNNMWYVHDNGTYAQWYKQYHSFAQNYIPQQKQSYGPQNIGILSQNCNVVSSSDLTNATITSAVLCMNTTAKTYYSQANFYAAQLMASTQGILNFTTSTTKFNGKPAITVALPTVFEPKLNVTLILNGSFTGLVVPAGKPAIFSVSATTLNEFGVGIVTTQVENIGNSAALFNVTLENCPGVTAQSGVSYQLTQGQGEDISTAVASADPSNVINEQCTVVVNDLTGGGSASAQVNINSGHAEQLIEALTNIFKALKIGSS